MERDNPRESIDSLEEKIENCKELIIQNVECFVQHKMFYMYLKDCKRDADVKQFSVNRRDGIIKV